MKDDRSFIVNSIWIDSACVECLNALSTGVSNLLPRVSFKFGCTFSPAASNEKASFGPFFISSTSWRPLATTVVPNGKMYV